MYIAAGVCSAGGLLAALTIRNPRRVGKHPKPCTNCPLDGPALALRPASHPGGASRERPKTPAAG
jgi:hypothetical protein